MTLLSIRRFAAAAMLAVLALPTLAATTTTLQLTSATGGTKLPFTIGQALRQGDVPASQVLVADLPGFQFVVKNRWPDGSAKFAVLSGRATLSPQVPKTVTLSTAPDDGASKAIGPASLAKAGLTASVQFGSYGAATWGVDDWGSPERTVVSGPQMSSFTYRRPIGSDKHLVAWLEVRSYKGGQIEVLPWVENGYLNVPKPGARSGNVSFTLGTTTRFNQGLTLLNHQRAVLASGSTLTHWFGTADPQITPRHDAAYLMSTRLVPNYRGATVKSSPLYERLSTSYTPLMQADFPPVMGATGYHPSIGLLPEWDVAYLTTLGDPRAYKAVLVNTFAAGRYGVHYRDETTHRPLKFSAYPHLVMSEGSGVLFIGGSSNGSYTPTPTGASPPAYDSPHHPSVGAMAYLVSGWHYALEESQFVATGNFLKNSDTTRQTTKGVFESNAGANTTRGAAWALRTLALAAALTPDKDPLRAELVASVDANIDHYHARYVATANNPLGQVEPYEHYTNTDPWEAASWMDDFFTGTVGYLSELRVNSPSRQTRLEAFRAHKYKAIVGRLGGSGAGAFSYRYAAQYTVPFAKTNDADWSDGSGPWYASWGAVAREMGLPTSGDLGEPLESGYPTEPTAYWGNLMPAISYAVDHGAPGAAEGWNRIIHASNFPVQATGYNDDPVWGVKPRSTP
ncbi:MAG TPA: hypothetical protein VFY73_10270 [Ideonella sp.]|uniref:hypothetical protein n=1 Tax=Ideonella sp. TaxID=1929293 RepID=UPI002E3527D8|nr:hypothetical protein [Ideonella sp.]HEX5684403.1 hypothetical protein [Ideonella sp.]